MGYSHFPWAYPSFPIIKVYRGKLYQKKKEKFIEEIHFKKVMLLKDWSDMSFLLSML